MVEAKELKTWTDDLKPVIFDINIAVSNLFILRHENSNKFKEEHQELYINLWYQQNFIAIIQLAKIFSHSSNQKLNIVKLCNRYKNEPLDTEIKEILIANKTKLNDVFRSRAEIIAAVKAIEIEITEVSGLIKKIETLRDKVFAHTDKEVPNDEISLEELITLKDLANKIYNTLFGKVFDEYFHFPLTMKYDFRAIIDSFK